MDEKNVRLVNIKNSYGKVQGLIDIFKWTSIGLTAIDLIYLVVILLTAKQIAKTSLVINIVVLSILFAITIGLIVLWFINNKKIKEIKNEGVTVDKSFIYMIEEYELRSIERNAKITGILVKTFIYIFLVFIAIIIIFPFYWMINSSLKTLDEYKETIPTFWPRTVVFQNYVDAYNTANLGILFINTLYVGLVSTILSLIITVITAFAFARLEFKGKNTLFAALLATMMIPGELFTITNYATVSQLGWKMTFAALIIPFLVSVFYIYLLRQNFMQIPNELYLAAKVDGTTDLKYLTKVMIPLSMPTLISITILKMMGAWNSYVWPNLVANDAAHRLITNGLRNSFTDSVGDVNYPVQMAAVALVSLPLFLVFIFLRKYIMKGVSRSGIKG